MQHVSTTGLPEYPVFDAVKKRANKSFELRIACSIAEPQVRLACALGDCRIPVTDPENREIRQNFGLRIVHRCPGMKR
jgi:hypothetical protein